MMLAKVKEQEGMMLAKVNEQDGTLTKVKYPYISGLINSMVLRISY